ncbi:MAG TPA: tyrosinase family protein [Pyrinomonadaceae bacterium]|nr:tyrosinase family protein [Pyrinomonadaceae bacterium]
MADVRIRQDVWKLEQTEEWHPTLLWYAKAIAAMQGKPINDPTSWRYQAAIHDYVDGFDPLATAADVLPSPDEQQRFWAQCQHFTWFFIPWHRMYLAFFEQIVAKTVESLGGPSDWALPYWNYSDDSNPQARLLPPAFRATELPDGSPNPLRVEERGIGVNEGEEFAFDSDVDLVTCLTEGDFISAPFGGDPGFGGRRTGFNHSGGAAGDLERVPHGSMHVAVGGDFGWMSGFNTAPLDPIFWLHHCNLDRLWTVWLRRDGTHVNPDEAQWLSSIKFDFHDASGAPVQMTCAEVLDTTAEPLLYDYEDVTDPIGGGPEAVGGVSMEEEEGGTPEMVGATEQPLTLTGEPATTTVPVSQPTGPALEATAAPRRVFLNLENIRSTGQPGGYKVYVNVPPGDNPEDHQELYAGLLPMFGVAESSDPARSHSGGSGLHYSLEITAIVRLLEERNTWDPNALNVTFVPRPRPTAGGLESTSARSPVQVGRVSLYYQ